MSTAKTLARTILIVEDNPQSMNLIRMTLAPYDYHLVGAIDGEEGLRIANEVRPDLIIMDIQLPKLDGLEVTRRLRLIPVFRQTPIVAVTALAMPGDRERILAAGCDAYLVKPLNIRELPGVIAQILATTVSGGVE